MNHYYLIHHKDCLYTALAPTMMQAVMNFCRDTQKNVLGIRGIARIRQNRVVLPI